MTLPESQFNDAIAVSCLNGHYAWYVNYEYWTGSLEDQVFGLMENLEAIQDTLNALTQLAPDDDEDENEDEDKEV